MIIIYPLKDLLQVSDVESEYIWKMFNKLNEWERIPAFHDTEQAIKKINEYKLDIYIVTSIDTEHKKAREKNLNELGLFPKEIICVGSNHGFKDKVIKEINPIAFVDDRLDHLYRSQEVEHLAWIDQKQEQIIEFNNYHSRVNSLFEWTSYFLPDIINKEGIKNENKNNKTRKHI